MAMEERDGRPRLWPFGIANVLAIMLATLMQGVLKPKLQLTAGWALLMGACLAGGLGWLLYSILRLSGLRLPRAAGQERVGGAVLAFFALTYGLGAVLGQLVAHFCMGFS